MGEHPAGYDAQIRTIRQRRGWSQARLASLARCGLESRRVSMGNTQMLSVAVFQMFSWRLLAGGFGPGYSHRPSTTTSREPPL